MRDYLNYISSPNDDRPLITGFDEKTGRPYIGFDPETGHIIEVLPTVVEAPAEPVQADEAVSATPVAEAPVEAAGGAPSVPAEDSNDEVKSSE
jgi:hypothetical protein